jgi:hypothetical protein
MALSSAFEAAWTAGSLQTTISQGSRQLVVLEYSPSGMITMRSRACKAASPATLDLHQALSLAGHGHVPGTRTHRMGRKHLLMGIAVWDPGGPRYCRH